MGETPEQETPIEKEKSPVEIAEGLLKRIDDATERLNKANQDAANNILAGTGGHIEATPVSPEEEKKVNAKEFFKGTNLETAIDNL